MNVEQTIRNGFSSIFAEYIKNGFPDNWQFVLRSRIEVAMMNCESSLEWSNRGNTITQTKNTRDTKV